MMIRRIVVDTTRRLISLYAIAGGVLFFLAWISNLSMRTSEIRGTFDHLFGWSMAAAWFLAASPVMLLETREIARLPISRREIWIARWWLAVVVPMVPIAIGFCAGALMGHVSAGPERFLLAIVYCLLYGGCYMGVSAAVPLTAFRTPGGWAVIRILIRMIVIPLGGALMPLWFAKFLPRTFHDLSGPAMGTLIAAAGVTVASYFNQPSIMERPSRAHAKPSKAVATERASMLDGLTSLPLLAFKEARKALLLYGTVLALTVVYWRIFESVGLVEFLRNMDVLIFAGLPGRYSDAFPPIAIVLIIGASDVGLMGDLRAYRALPISVTRLSAILTGLSLTTTSMLWVILLSAHLIAVGGAPPSLRADLFFVVSAGLALSTTLRLVVPLDGTFKIFISGFVVVPFLLAFRAAYGSEAGWAHAAVIAGGGAALIVSWFLNRRALQRGGRVYKMKSPIPSISS